MLPLEEVVRWRLRSQQIKQSERERGGNGLLTSGALLSEISASCAEVSGLNTMLEFLGLFGKVT